MADEFIDDFLVSASEKTAWREPPRYNHVPGNFMVFRESRDGEMNWIRTSRTEQEARDYARMWVVTRDEIAVVLEWKGECYPRRQRRPRASAK